MDVSTPDLRLRGVLRSYAVRGHVGQLVINNSLATLQHDFLSWMLPHHAARLNAECVIAQRFHFYGIALIVYSRGDPVIGPAPYLPNAKLPPSKGLSKYLRTSFRAFFLSWYQVYAET